MGAGEAEQQKSRGSPTVAMVASCTDYPNRRKTPFKGANGTLCESQSIKAHEKTFRKVRSAHKRRKKESPTLPKERDRHLNGATSQGPRCQAQAF